MGAEYIELRIHAGIASLHLNRPEKRNAMNEEFRAQLIAALERVSVDREIRALVLTGNGKAFCAGGDIAAMEKRFDMPAGEIGIQGWRRQQRVRPPVSALILRWPVTLSSRAPPPASRGPTYTAD